MSTLATFLTPLATANVWSNLALIPLVALMMDLRYILLVEMFCVLTVAVFTFAYHAAQFANVAEDTTLYLAFRLADIAAAQFAFPLAACSIPVMHWHTRWTVLLVWFIVHVFLHVANFYSIWSVYVAIGVIVLTLGGKAAKLNDVRITSWRTLLLSVLFAGAGVTFYYLDGSDLIYYQYHPAWHGCIFTALFLLFYSMIEWLRAEQRVLARAHEIERQETEIVKSIGP